MLNTTCMLRFLGQFCLALHPLMEIINSLKIHWIEVLPALAKIVNKLSPIKLMKINQAQAE